MKVNASAKVFGLAVAALVVAVRTFIEARNVNRAEVERMSGWNFEPGLNSWHGWTALLITISVGLTIGASILERSEMAAEGDPRIIS